MTTTASEAQARYERLTKHIAAIDDDIGRELDSLRKLTLQERRAELIKERDMVQAEMVAQDKRTNGDLETLQRKVSELATVLVSDHTQQAHAIIQECSEALVRIDARLFGVEGKISDHESRLTAVETHINPPVTVTIWRFAALFVVLFGGTLFWVKESREVLFGLYIWAGLMIETVLVLLAVACLMLASAKLRESER